MYWGYQAAEPLTASLNKRVVVVVTYELPEFSAVVYPRKYQFFDFNSNLY